MSVNEPFNKLIYCFILFCTLCLHSHQLKKGESKPPTKQWKQSRGNSNTFLRGQKWKPGKVQKVSQDFYPLLLKNNNKGYE